jgi:type IV conjugative transfer system protein TraE
MADPKPGNYLEVVANAFKAAQAWRAATFALGVVVAILAFALVQSARNATVILLPHDLATIDQKMTVPLSGELRGTSVEYVANIAMADLALILNFTPDNVLTQHQRFLNRLTETLYGSQREVLLAQAAEMKQRNITQAFFPTEVRVSPDSTTAQVSGTQIRYIGGKETMRLRVQYTITYSVHRGYMHVSDLRQR